MKKRVKHHLKHHLKRFALGAVALAALVAVDGGQMSPANAGVRVEARLQLPNLTVHYRNAPQPRRVVRRAHEPFVIRITAQDRVIARRLARSTGHRTIVLLDLRARGLNWHQIGHRLDIPRGLVRVAIRGNARPAHAGIGCSTRGRGR